MTSPNKVWTASAIRDELLQIILDLVDDVTPQVPYDIPILDLGVSSLALVKGMRRIYDRFGVLVSIRRVIEGQITLEELALYIDHERNNKQTAGDSNGIAAPAPKIWKTQREVSLAPSQQHIGFLSRYSSEASAAFNEVLMLRLKGMLDGPALQAAVEQAGEAFESMRTALDPDRDTLIVGAGSPLELRLLSVSPDVLEPRLTEIAARPFEPGERLFRAELLRLSETEHALALVGHMLVLERQAMIVILDYIAELYGLFSRDENACPAPAIIQWTDYLAMGDTSEAFKIKQMDESYWLEVFGSEVPRLEIPSDFPRPAIKKYKGARLAIPIEPDLKDRLQTWSSLAGFSAENVLLGAFTAYLHRISDSNDLVVGFESEPLYLDIGVPAVARTRNMVPLRSVFDPKRSFFEHVRSQAELIDRSQEHKHLSFAELIQLLKLPRDQSRSALFTAAFCSWSQAAAPTFAGLQTEFILPPSAGARYDIELVSLETESGAWLVCDYSTELFEGDTISNWLQGMLGLLNSGLGDPSTACSLLEMMQPFEREKLINEWNQTKTSFPQDRTVLDLILEQARNRRDQTAIRFNEYSLSYGQLLERIETLSTCLHSQGIRKGDRVGILLKRSLDLIPAILATWRLGALYIPMDKGFPRQRLAFIIADAGVQIVIANRELLSLLESEPGVNVLSIEDVELKAASNLEQVSQASGSDSAVIFFTSGSTGKPKGVEIRHNALLNSLLAAKGYLEFTPSNTMLAMTTIAFDISTNELLMPLLSGGCVELGEDDLVADGLRIVERLESRRPSHVQVTPSTWKAILTAGWRGDQDITLLTAGEALSRDLAEQLLERCYALWNLYGPTETTVYSTAYRVKSAPGEVMRIGRPLPNNRMYILDREVQPVPRGAIGELFIGGDGVANGYWQKPGLTAERFIPDPFRSGERIYRTGDLARYSANGDIIYLGRSDDQVKIHGVRIEPGEIEAALRGIAGVRDAAVVSWKDSHGDLQLVGHVIANGKSAPTVSELRAQLRLRLPEGMIPPYIVYSDKFPLTPNGKVHRASLPSPDEVQLERIGENEQPKTATERSLADAWASVLEIDVGMIGRDSDFMDLGGHSLLMTRLMLALRQRFQVNFNLVDFFGASTIRKFAALIDKQHHSGNGRNNHQNQPASTRRGEWSRQRMAFLQREAQLPLYIAPARGLAFQPGQEVRAVFLTGATGFLGAYLVTEILNTTTAEIFCLVRPKRGENGKERIEKQMRRYDLWAGDESWQTAWDNRLKVIEGDVTLERMGLPDAIYETLARKVDTIFHGAAHVNFIYPYEALRATNVLGLHEIIRFAFYSRIKPVHHLSTAAIWPMGAQYRYYEKDPIDHNGLLNLGYDEAKWVGEKCLLYAAERGLPVVRYRPGEVGGDSLTGRCVPDHFIITAFKGFLQFGAFPNLDIEVDIAPVDYVARSMVYLAFHRNPFGRAFHLTNPHRSRMSQALMFLRNLGYQFEELEFEELRNRLVNSPDFSANALFAFQTTLEDMDNISMELPTYDTREVQRELEGSGIICPPADEKLFGTYLRYLQEIQFVPQPEVLVGRA